jgi:hypothetical protein
MTKISELQPISGSQVNKGDLFVTVNLGAGEQGTKNITRTELVKAIQQENFTDIKITGGQINNVNLGVFPEADDNISKNSYFVIKDVDRNKTVAFTIQELEDVISSDSVGDEGFTGSQGIQGPQGFTGSQGAQATSITFIDSVAEIIDLPSANNIINDAYLVLDDENLYVWNGTVWSNTGKILGPIGFTGSQGETGYVGSRGEDGFTGSVGFSGSRGFTGSVGFVGSVGFNGSRGLLGFTGSRGIAGPTGSQGVIGFTGSRGTPGDFAAIGFTGSQGTTGFTGSRGTTGFTGSQGPIGFTGSRSSVTVNNDFSDETRFVTFSDVSSGTINDLYVSSTNLLFNPSSGQLSSVSIRVDNIVDKVGTGAPSFPNGIISEDVLRVDQIVNQSANSAPDFPNGIDVAGGTIINEDRQADNITSLRVEGDSQNRVPFSPIYLGDGGNIAVFKSTTAFVSDIEIPPIFSSVELEAPASSYPAFYITAWGGNADGSDDANRMAGDIACYRIRGTLDSPLSTLPGDYVGESLVMHTTQLSPIPQNFRGQVCILKEVLMIQ